MTGARVLVAVFAAVVTMVALSPPTAGAHTVRPERFPGTTGLEASSQPGVDLDAELVGSTVVFDGSFELAQDDDDDKRYGRGFETPIGALSVLRVGAAAFAAIVVFVILSWPLKRTGPDSAERDDDVRARSPILPNVPVRVLASVAVFVVALLVLAE